MCCMVFEKLCRGNRQAREHGHDGVGRNLCRGNRGARKHGVGRRRLNRRHSRGGRTGNFRQRGAHAVGVSVPDASFLWPLMYMILNLIKIRSSIRSYVFCCCYTTSDCIILEDMSDLEALIVQSLNNSVPKAVDSIFCILFVYTVCLF